MRDLVTTVLELVGLLLLISAAAVLAASYAGPPAGLAAGGALLVAVAGLLEWRRPGRRTITTEDYDA